MAIPETNFDGNEVPDEDFVPPNPVSEEVFPENDDRDVPCVCPCDCHVVVAPELVAFRNVPVFPFVGRVGGSGLAFQSGVLPNDEAVYVGVHEWIFCAFVDGVGAPFFFSGLFRETPCHVVLEVASLTHGFAVGVVRFRACLVLIDGEGGAVGVQSADSSGIRASDSVFPLGEPFFAGHAGGLDPFRIVFRCRIKEHFVGAGGDNVKRLP